MLVQGNLQNVLGSGSELGNPRPTVIRYWLWKTWLWKKYGDDLQSESLAKKHV